MGAPPGSSNQFLNSVASQKPTTPAPNYLGKVGGLMQNLIKPSAPAIPQVNNNAFLGGYGTGNQFLGSMGQPAKAPEQNIAKPATTIAPTQAKTVITQPTGTTSKVNPQNTVGGTYNPTSNPNGTQAPTGYTNPNAAQDTTVKGATYAPYGTQQATPDVPTPVTQAQPSPYTANNGLYGQLITGLANRSTQGSPEYNQAYSQAQILNDQLKQSRTNQANAEAENRLNPIPIGDQTGREAVMRNQYLNQQNALSSQFQGATNLIAGANTQQGLQQSGLNQAAGLAAPQFPSYGQSQFNPVTGQYNSVGGGQSGGGTPQVSADTYAQDVISGNRSYGDAVSAMGMYGNAGKQFLDQAIRSRNPNFNFAQADVLAGQQGTIGPNYALAEQAISNLESVVQNLGPLQGTNVPGINAIGNAFSGITGIGSENTRSYTQAVQSARAAYAALISSVKGGLPSDYSSQALAEIPDNPTPNDIAALRHSFEVLGQARKDIFGTPGTGSNTTSSTSGGSLYSW